MRARLPSTVLAAALMIGACTGGGGNAPAPGTPGSKGIPQPVVPHLDVAPESKRVDLRVPTFSHPTEVTNPLFPVSRQASVLFLGHVDGKPFRTEVTLLPETRIVQWEGQWVETLVSQYMAYLGGRIQEVAYDLYAQADDGSVWYFGEDVADFEGGAIVTKEGTWIVGKDGPAAMIMPADPKVGNAYRTENTPGIAFEQVTVTSVDRTLDGPLGPIHGGLVAEELHMDGTTEEKLFAPGYGEFLTAGGGDVEALALAVPTDAASGPLPAELVTLERGATEVFDAARSSNWPAASSTAGRMKAAWDAYGAEDVPTLIRPMMTRVLDELDRAVRARDIVRARQAAIDVAQSTLDLELRYRPASEVNLARFDLWAGQLMVDAAGRDVAAVRGDVFTLGYIRDRILHALNPAEFTAMNIQLGRLQIASLDGALARASRAARKLRTVTAGLM
ncbi:MAG TPA: hypothetical protein VFM85_10280 [Actinomycetota bacterium]|nr:hypothetical protein [Actinomycetota bacterium]